MPQNIYPIYYIQVLKELEKRESTKRELRQKLGLTNSRLYRAIYKLQVDGLITKDTKNNEEFFRITDKGREYLRQLKELVNA